MSSYITLQDRSQLFVKGRGGKHFYNKPLSSSNCVECIFSQTSKILEEGTNKNAHGSLVMECKGVVQMM